MDALVTRFAYYPLYTATSMFGDIGGYLGLMLGLSVFSLADLAELVGSVSKERKKKKEKRVDTANVNKYDPVERQKEFDISSRRTSLEV